MANLFHSHVVTVLLVAQACTILCQDAFHLSSNFRAIFALDLDEGACFLQVLQTEGDSGIEETFGWVEVWQEGHRLMLNTTDTEVAITTRGIDTYLWASVFDEKGRWIAESNVLHTGHHAGVEIRFDEDLHDREWYEGDPLEFDFRLPLVSDFKEYAVDSIICIINNQTVGKMGMEQTITESNHGQMWRYVHHGQVEVGRHSLSLAVLPPNHGVPSVLSDQTWFSILRREVEVYPLVDVATFAKQQEDAPMQHCDEDAFSSCFAAAQRRIPPNRQYTEVLDAADTCAQKHCSDATDDDRKLQQVMRSPLIEMLQEHMSAVIAQWQVAESFMRAARVLQCLDQRQYAIRAIRTVLRLVGYSSSPPVRQQCTYPGCNEMSKDACNIVSRLLRQQGSQLGPAAAASYVAFLHDIIPQHVPPPLPPHLERYTVSDIVFGCLSTLPSYRSRADVVKATWWPFVVKGHFYGDAPDSALPVTPYSVFERGVLAEYEFLWGQIAAADYASSHPKFFMALLDMFARHPDASWFFLGGDDNFVVPAHLPPLLHHLDAADTLIVGGPLGQHIGVGAYPAGGSGILFSNGFLRKVWRRLPAFATSWREQRGKHMLCHPCGDVSFGFLARDAGARVVEVPCMHGMWPEYFAMHASPAVPPCAAVVGAAPKPRITCDRPATFHYVQPRAMRLLAHFFFQDEAQ